MLKILFLYVKHPKFEMKSETQSLVLNKKLEEDFSETESQGVLFIVDGIYDIHTYINVIFLCITYIHIVLTFFPPEQQ